MVPLSIEHLRPGDWVLSHTGTPRRVRRVIRRPYVGILIGVRTARSPGTLWVTPDHYLLCRLRVLSYHQGRAWAGVPGRSFGRARELRAEMTGPERALCGGLSNAQLGLKFRRQHPIGPFIADFYARDAGLVVELDGDSHAGPEAAAYDAARSDRFAALGLQVLRFSNADVIRHGQAVLEEIAAAAAAVRPADLPAQQWRRADTLRVGDTLCHGPDRLPAEVVELQAEAAGGEVYDLEVEGDPSFLTEVCAVHHCGSLRAA